MRIASIVLILASLLSSCSNNPETRGDGGAPAVAFDPIVSRAKETSLYTDRVDWPTVNQRFVELRRAKSGDSLEALQYLVDSLGDEHAAIRSAKDFSILAFFRGERKYPDTRDPAFVNRVINDTTARFSSKLIEPNVGYLRVVGIGPGDLKVQAGQIRSGLIDLKRRGVDRWILDLRFNGGGNMEPMLAGLAPLLGDGSIGGAVNGDNEVTREYQIQDGQFINTGRLVCEMPDEPQIAPGEKVAVLLSRYTASSGELVALAFEGRPNTRFIGEATAGYTTGTGFDAIDDDLIMLISEDLFIDRDKNRYERHVDVDDSIEFQHQVELVNDAQVERAMEWLGQ